MTASWSPDELRLMNAAGRILGHNIQNRRNAYPNYYQMVPHNMRHFYTLTSIIDSVELGHAHLDGGLE